MVPIRVYPSAGGSFEGTTRIEEDLGVTGDDADELMAAFAREFDVDLTGLRFHRHFGPEGCFPLGCGPLYWFYRPDWIKDLNEIGKFPITVQHLVQVAQDKRWSSPPRVR